jgi:hypothetical protein
MPVTESGLAVASDVVEHLRTLSLIQPAAGPSPEEALERNRELVESLPGLSPAAKLSLYMALYERGC